MAGLGLDYNMMGGSPSSATTNSNGVDTTNAYNPFMALSTVFGGFLTAGAINNQGSATRDAFAANAEFSKIQAQDAIRRGDISAMKYKTKVRQLLGSQRASMAAQGINVSGQDSSAADIQKQTLEYGYQDVQQIKNNAFREAWGLKFQASQYEAAGQNAQLEAKAKSTNTLISSGLQAAGYGYKTYKDYKAGT